MANLYTESMLETLLDLARWGDAFPESPSKNHFGPAHIEVTFPDNLMRVVLLEDAIEVHDLSATDKEEGK